jgi:hypothetical protein
MGATGRREGLPASPCRSQVRMRARDFCATERELNLAHRRTQAPRLLGTGSQSPPSSMKTTVSYRYGLAQGGVNEVGRHSNNPSGSATPTMFPAAAF